MASIIYFSCAVHAMDVPEKGEPKNITSSKMHDSDEGKNALTRRRSTEKMRGNKSENADDSIVIQVLPDAEDKKNKRKSPVPPLQFTANELPSIVQAPQQLKQRNSRSQFHLSQQPSIDSKAELLTRTASLRVVDKKVRNRSASMSVMQNNISKKDDDYIAEPRKRTSLLPKAVAQQMVDIDLSDDEKTMYTQEQVWALVGAFNPVLFDFATRHGITDLEELASYAEVMEGQGVKARALIEHIYQNHEQPESNSWIDQGLQYIFGDAHKQNLDRLDKMYEKMRKENPEGYKLVMLELIKGAADEAAGQERRSAIADTHVALQNKQSANDQAQIRLQYLGLLVTLATTAVGGITSLYQYFTPPPPAAANNCTCP